MEISFASFNTIVLFTRKMSESNCTEIPITINDAKNARAERFSEKTKLLDCP